MLFALFADLHANREALEACIAHAEASHADRYVILGDLVGYGADPAWVVDRIMQLVERGNFAVLGNHDAAVAWAPNEAMRGDARKAIAWTRDRLTRKQRDFLESLPKTIEDTETLYVH